MAHTLIPFNGYIEPQENEFFLIVNIKNTFYCNDKKDSVYYRENLYECTRKYWKMAADKPKKITKVLGHVDGIVQCVITPTSWYRTNVERVLGRFECDGIVEDDSPYLGKSILGIVDTGRNPVRYYNQGNRKKELYYIESIHEVYESENMDEGENGFSFMTTNKVGDRVDANTVQVVMFKVVEEVDAPIKEEVNAPMGEGFDEDSGYKIDFPTPLILQMNRSNLQYANGGSVRENDYVFYAPGAEIQFENANESQLVGELNLRERQCLEDIEIIENYEELWSLEHELYDYHHNNIESFHVNIGHGNCSLILAYNKKNEGQYKLLMVDCGIFDYTNKRNYATNLKKCFDHIAEKLNISIESIKVSAFLLTHTHYDHYSGLDYLLRNGYVDLSTIFIMNILYGCKSTSWIKILEKIKGCKVAEPIRGKVPFVLFPEIRQVCKGNLVPETRVVAKVNDSSVVYCLGHHRQSMIFPGDLEQKGLQEMNKNHYCRYDYHHSQYYCISHHGSITGHINIKCQHVHCTILDCVKKSLRTSIIMGRKGAFSGIYSPEVIKDFGSSIVFTERDNNGNPIAFVELDWKSGNVSYYK